MVSELGKAFLRVLASTDRPMDYWKARDIVHETTEMHVYYSFPTYIKRYLIDKGLVVRFTMPDKLKSWYAITKKGLLEIEPKRTTKQLRARLSTRISEIFQSQTIYPMGHGGYLRKVLPVKLQNHYEKIEQVMKILPNSESSACHYFTKEYANLYLRYWNDTEDKHIVKIGLDLLRFHVPEEFIRKYLLKKIQASIKNEIMSRMEFGAYIREEIDLPIEMLEIAKYFNMDSTESLVKGARRFAQKKQEWEDHQRTQQRCVNCGAPIHSHAAVEEAVELERQTGIRTGVLCCNCYSKAIEETL